MCMCIRVYNVYNVYVRICVKHTVYLRVDVWTCVNVCVSVYVWYFYDKTVHIIHYCKFFFLFKFRRILQSSRWRQKLNSYFLKRKILGKPKTTILIWKNQIELNLTNQIRAFLHESKILFLFSLHFYWNTVEPLIAHTVNS